jgi:phthalate 4,5-cis-dihydrodiol dehydrogenase
MTVRPLKMGVAGLGQAAGGVMPSMAAMPEIDLVAGADINPQMCRGFEERYPGTRTYDTIAGLCRDPEVEAVWVSTPNRLHCEHAIEAMRNGKHVAVEKPMAVTLEEADRMCAAAEQYGVKLLAGHTSSYGLGIRAMRKLATNGSLGRIQSIFVWSYTDWILRPRTRDELVFEEGGGLVHRQGPHQIDTVRLLGGGMLRSVRGSMGRWMPERPIPGFYTAYLEFDDGTSATILHNGYGYFLTAELYPWAPAMHRYQDEDRIAFRRAIRAGGRDEESEKAEFRIGGRLDKTLVPAPAERPPWTPYDMGMLVLSCERGDVRHSKYGLTIYGDEGREELDLRSFGRNEADFEGGVTLQALEELHAAVVLGKPVYHSGHWGRATLEATLAIIQSTHERREILLERQVEMPESYDADFSLETAKAGTA